MTLTYAGTFKQSLLMDELLAAFPGWIIGEGMECQCLLHLEGNQQGVRLTVPDGSDEQAIEAVITAHDPNTLSIGEQMEVNRETVRQALLDSPLANMTPEEIFITVRSRIQGWGSLADAKADFLEWEPLLWAVVMWLVRNR
jgi:hypothetical protein